MGMKIQCPNCNKQLDLGYTCIRFVPGTPIEIIKMDLLKFAVKEFKNKCPKCGKKLI